MPIPPPNFKRPSPGVPGAIPRPGAIPARPPGAGIPPRPGLNGGTNGSAPTQTPPNSVPATQALPTVATSTSALHPVTQTPQQRQSSAQPDAAQEFVMQFKKQLLPYLVQ